MTALQKRIVVIEPDGAERVLELGDELPKLKQMQEIVGGWIELVKVLRQDVPGFEYTYMVVNEEGLNEGLPRNQKATDLYLANVRRRFPDHAEPHKAATEAWLASLPQDAEVHFIPRPDGYDDDPWIAGTVIWFDGWTIDELAEAGF